LRVPARFGALFALCAAIAAALAFARVTASLSQRMRTLTAIAAAAVLVAEAWPQMTLSNLPAPLAIEAPLDEQVAMLELPIGSVAADTAALFRSIGHRLPTVNGYSGYQPTHYTLLRIALELGDEHALDPFTRDRDLLVAIGDEDRERWSSLVRRHPRAVLIVNEDRCRLFRVPHAVPVEHRAPGTRVSIRSVTASKRPGDTDRMLDRNLATSWNSGRPQAGDEELTIDLSEESDVSALRLELGRFGVEFPRQLIVDCAGADERWQTCWNGSAAAAAISGVLDDATNTTMTLFIDRAAVRRIRVRETAADAVNTWSIAELSVYGTAGHHTGSLAR
jgi:hypothetical protein